MQLDSVKSFCPPKTFHEFIIGECFTNTHFARTDIHQIGSSNTNCDSGDNNSICWSQRVLPSILCSSSFPGKCVTSVLATWRMMQWSSWWLRWWLSTFQKRQNWECAGLCSLQGKQMRAGLLLTEYPSSPLSADCLLLSAQMHFWSCICFAVQRDGPVPKSGKIHLAGGSYSWVMCTDK